MLSTAYVLPTNEIETALVSIWEKILDVRPIGISDNFFDLGGHSLSATRVVSRIFTRYQLEIPLHSLFQSPTIAEMAAVINQHQGKLLDESRLSAILDELASMSEAEAERLVSETIDRQQKSSFTFIALPAHDRLRESPNGTQEILLDRHRLLASSVHG